MFPEQIAIRPDGRTTTRCAGIWDDAQIEGLQVERGAHVRRECNISVGVSWNLGVPAEADRVIREELVDLVFIVRPALANPHWPVWAARELSHPDPFSLVPEDWGWWLRNFPDQSRGDRLAASAEPLDDAKSPMRQ